MTQDALIPQLPENQDTPYDPHTAAPLLAAADMHNFGNNHARILSPSYGYSEDDLSAWDSTARFIRASTYAGVNELYNMVQTVGSWATQSDPNIRDTADYLMTVDSNLVDYYANHKDAIDTVGFIGASMLPGSGSMKLLNVGQAALRSAVATGKIGSTLGRGAVGLLAPNQPGLLKKAVVDIAASDTPFKLTRASVLKNLVAGVWQNTLEAGAFELATAATMYNSPVLEKQSVSDLFWNGATFAGVGGIIGGTFAGAKAVGAIKAGVRDINKSFEPIAGIKVSHEFTNGADNFLWYLNQKNSLPQVSGVADEFLAYGKQVRERTLKSLDLKLLEAANQLAGNDPDLGRVLWHGLKDRSDQEAIDLLSGSVGSSRLGKKLKIEQELAALNKKDITTLTSEELVRTGNIGTRYFVVTGERQGEIVSSAPLNLRLADTLDVSKRQRIEVKGNKVIAGEKQQTFALNDGWDIFSADHLNAEMRQIWAKSLPRLKPDTVINSTDIPLLEKMYREFDTTLKVKGTDGQLRTFSSQQDFKEWLIYQKQNLATQLVGTMKDAAKGTKFSQDEIASIVNVNTSVLSGVRSVDDDIFFADQFAAKKYTEALVAQGARHVNEPLVDIHSIPSVIKVGYDTTPITGYDGNTLKGLMIVQHKQEMYQDHIDNVFAAFMPEGTAAQFPEKLSYAEALSANVVDAPGHGAVHTSNAPYSTLGNIAEFVGNQASKARLKAGDTVKEELNSVASALLRNESAAIEWSTLQARVRGIPEHYILDRETQQLKLKKVADFEAKLDAAQQAGKDVSKLVPPQIDPNIPYTIDIKHQETWDTLVAHVMVDEKRVYAHSALNSAEGVESLKMPGVFYPPAPNVRDYRHFAFVEDTSVIGTGRKRMIYAQSAEALDALIQAIKPKLPQHVRVSTRKEAEEYFKAAGKFDYEQTLDDIDFDRTLRRAGYSAPEFVPTRPDKIVDDWLNWNVDREHALVTRLVSAKYQPILDTIKRQGDRFTNVATSVKGSSKSLARYAESSVDNPYADYVRTFLGFPRTAPFNDIWFTPQKRIEEAFSKMYSTVSEMIGDSKGVKTSGEQLEKINTMLREHGYGGVAYDEAINHWVNHTAPRGALTSFARKANAIVAALTLRLDGLNAWVNAVSSNILYHPELRKVISALETGDGGVIGSIAVPGAGGDRILSPVKLQAEAISSYFTELAKGDKSELIKMYKDAGFMTSYSDQFKYIIDELTLTGRETAHDMIQKEAALTKIHRGIVEAVNKGEKLTLNKHAEDFNRFVAAETARKVWQAAADKGLITQAEVMPNVFTFVRRTQGTYEAFLRPAVFKGPVGQFIGLFQTYQFNLMQQLFRHVEDGYMKSAMLLMGLQGSIWGLQGLPAFNAINTHLIGKASGNTENKDVYSTVYSGPSVEAAEWVMYGAASNLLGLVNDELKVNLYSRGDINPRHLTVLPTSVEDVPAVNAAAKFFGGIKTGLTASANGAGVWQSILTGLEHGSLNRPMAGFAQVLQATDNPYSLSFGTSNKGNIIMANELYSLANLSRLAGGKPFDEAVLRDLEYRSQIYSTHMENKRNILGKAIKEAAYAGKTVTHDQVVEFAQNWVHIGGDITRFNQFMLDSMTKGNRDMNQRLAESLKSPTLQRLQKQMGGEDNQAITQEGLPVY